jgi:hypothetical protein
MRLVGLLILLASIAFCDTDYITCSTGTRDYDNEVLFEGAQGNLSGRGRVRSLGCNETYSVAAIEVDGQTNESATNYMEFSAQNLHGRTLSFSTALSGLGITSGYTKVTKLRITNVAATGVGFYTNTTNEGNILFDGVLVESSADIYGAGNQGMTNNTIRNCVFKLTNATGAQPAIYAFSAGSNVVVENCTIKKTAGDGIRSLTASLAITVKNTAIKAPVCLSSTNTPVYTSSKVYTSDATGTNTNITDPQFNFDTDGYSLLPGSLLINNGNDIAGFTNSVNGVTRPSGYWDAGAYELLSGNPSTGTRSGILYRMGLAPRSR